MKSQAASLLFIVVLVTTASCHRSDGNPQANNVRLADTIDRSASADASTDDEVYEAVFAQLLTFRRHSLQGENARYLFVGIGTLQQLSDPSPSLLLKLQSVDSRVRPQSAAIWDVKAGVRLRGTDQPGLLFYAKQNCGSTAERFIRSGYIEHGKSGMQFLMRVGQQGNDWEVAETGRTGVS